MVVLQDFYIDQIFELYKIAQSHRHVWYNNMVEIENLVGKEFEESVP